ncbi:putative serine/threonine protein kinase, putative,protein kinase [Trypanosoma grayi]|uniref:putative serine/threonine protein kinase, putative,protein kinase n=1 Tax=Trypanosoma grayi TaxID=71804 RepID=UPI0004F46FD9|nr:putative serine/threonine protein kinase, putative,protein kinase [Trypanosoma grayi]KEG14591.1 putative serine/threonine protein kinase, putative,protein kinase [Trypanosoma grayi]
MDRVRKIGLFDRLSRAFGWGKTAQHDCGDLREESDTNATHGCRSDNSHAKEVDSALLRKTLTPTSANNKSLSTSPQANACEKDSVEAAQIPSGTQRQEDPVGMLSKTDECEENVLADPNGFFSFLDDVIAGKNKQLLEEMNRQRQGGGDDQQNTAVGSGSRLTATPQNLNLLSATSEKQDQPREDHEGNELKKQGLSLNRQKNRVTSFPSSSAARSLKDYELVAYLGKGSFAEVTLARHKVTQKLYALKKISKLKVQEEGCIRSTLMERQLLASLSHPFLIRLHRAFQSHTHLYLVLDFAQGGDLYYFLETKPWVRDMRRRLQRMQVDLRGDEASSVVPNSTAMISTRGECDTKDRRLGAVVSPSFLSLSSTLLVPLVSDGSRTPIRLVAFYAIELALVLQYLHENGFVYRDLKPENVLMTRDGHVMLTDFGVAKYGGRNKPQKAGNERMNSFTGTTQYMSPEMLLGKSQGPRIDWWSFGCMLFEMITGRRPFEAESQYAVVQAIVECDVQVRHDDFLFTSLEVETRVMQLHKRHQELKLHILRHVMYQRSRDDVMTVGGEKNERIVSPLYSSTPEMQISDSYLSYIPAALSRSIPSNIIFPDEMPSMESDLFFGISGEKVNVFAPMTKEERSHYLLQATEEMTEAINLLQKLVLMLLERRPEQRLSGPAVLEHPFFSCAYVTSQLYYERPPASDNLHSSSVCSPIKSGGMAVNTPSSLYGSSAGDAFPCTKRPTLPSTSCSPGASHGAVAEEVNNSDGKNVGTDPSQTHGSPAYEAFTRPAITPRPENWRELFLERKVRSLYTPRLRASDDLRYFPSAVTATGVSVVAQQQALREQARRRSERSHHHNDEEATASAYAPAEVSSASASPQFNTEDVFTEQRALPDYIVSEEEEDEETVPLSSAKEIAWGTSLAAKESATNVPGLSASSEQVRSPAPGRQLESTDSDFARSLEISAFGSASTTPLRSHRAKGDMSAEGATVLSTPDPTASPPELSATPPPPAPLLLQASMMGNAVAVPDAQLKTGMGRSGQGEVPHGMIRAAEVQLDSDPPLIGEGGKENAFFAPSRSTSDDEDGLLQTLVDSVEALPDTLCGIAYDVDDYALSRSSSCGYSKQKRSPQHTCFSLNTWMYTRNETSSGKGVDQPSQSSRPSVGAAGDSLRSGEHLIPPSECVCPGYPIVSHITPTAPATDGSSMLRSRRTNPNRFVETDTLHISNPSLFSLTELASNTSPTSMAEMGDASEAPVGGNVRTLPLCKSAQDQPLMGGRRDDRISSPLLDTCSVGGTGGAQHYLGFTFEAHSGGAILLGGAASSGDKMNFSGLM